MESPIFQAYQTRIEEKLTRYLPQPEDDPTGLYEAMRYSVLGGGKRLRPLLVYTIGQSLGATLEQLDHAAIAVELIHAYSLIHDDLPAMDDDDLRRGKPTCHKIFGEAIAILAGDTLQPLAFQILADSKGSGLPPATHLAMVSCLTQACGVTGMAWGQALDLWATSRTITHAEIERIHRCKTGALLHACVRLGFLAAALEDPQLITLLDDIGHTLGLAFQIQDDILDLESSTIMLGKPQGSDVKKGKATYPSTLGIENSKQALHQLYQRLETTLTSTPRSFEPLKQLVESIFGREY